MHNERHEELGALHILGISSEAESLEFVRYLAEGCPPCEQILPEIRAAASAIASNVRPMTPRPEVRRRILDSIGPRPVADAAPTPPERSRPSRGPWLLAAAASLLLLLLAWDDARLRRAREEIAGRSAALSSRLQEAERELARRDLRVRVLESDDVRVLFLSGKDPQPDARAKVFWSETAKRGFLVAGRLQALPPGRQYQLWVFDRGKPVDAGVFDVDDSGRALFESKDLSPITRAENFAVTVEPQGGVPQPTGPIVLIGST